MKNEYLNKEKVFLKTWLELNNQNIESLTLNSLEIMLFDYTVVNNNLKDLKNYETSDNPF